MMKIVLFAFLKCLSHSPPLKLLRAHCYIVHIHEYIFIDNHINTKQQVTYSKYGLNSSQLLTTYHLIRSKSSLFNVPLVGQPNGRILLEKIDNLPTTFVPPS